MNKRIIRILVITALLGISVTPVFAEKNVETVNGVNNFNIDNYKLERIVEKEGINFYLYKHKKSGGQVILYSIKNKDDQNFTAHHSGIYFNCFQKNNEGAPHFLEHLIGGLIEKEINEIYTPLEIYNYNKNQVFAETRRLGLGFNLNVGKWNKKIVDVIVKVLNNPQFSEELSEAEKKRMIIELKGFKKDFLNSNDFLKERMIGGLYKTSGVVEEIKKLNLPLIKKIVKKYINPSNMLLVMSKDVNKNYKEILKQFDEEYFSKFNTNEKEKEVNIYELINKEPFRKKDVENIKYHNYISNTEKNFKYKSRVYFNLKEFSPKERDIFRMRNSDIFDKVLAEEIKNLGYKKVKVNSINELSMMEYDPAAIDGLFYIDLYGNDSSKFNEKALKENSKKLLNKFYEKIKNLKGKEIFNLYNDGFYSIKSHKVLTYRDEEPIVDFICKSFSLTKNPFSEKFYDIEKNKILDDTNGERSIENIEKYKENLKSVAEKGPACIDILEAKSTKQKEKEDEEFKTYKSPIEIKEENKELKDIIENFIHRRFLWPNLNDTGLSYAQFFGRQFEVYKPNKKAIEKYLLHDLKEDLKNYNLTEEEVKKEKEKYLREMKDTLKDIEEQIKRCKEKLNNKEKIKIEAKDRKESCLESIKSLERRIKELEKTIKETKDSEKLKDLNKNLATMKKEIKNSRKNVKQDFVKNVVSSYKNTLKNREMEIPHMNKRIEDVEKITLKDFKNALTSIEIDKELKEYDKEKDNKKLG